MGISVLDVLQGIVGIGSAVSSYNAGKSAAAAAKAEAAYNIATADAQIGNLARALPLQLRTINDLRAQVSIAQDAAAIAKTTSGVHSQRADYLTSLSTHTGNIAAHTQAGAALTDAQAGHTQAGADLARSRADHVGSVAAHTAAGAVLSEIQAGHTEAGAALTEARADLTGAQAGHTRAGAGLLREQAGHTQAGAALTRAEAGHVKAGAAYTRERSGLKGKEAGLMREAAQNLQNRSALSMMAADVGRLGIENTIFNAEVQERLASEALFEGEFDVETTKIQLRQMRGAAEANAAARGVVVGSGSAADINTSITFMGNREIGHIRREAARTALGHETQATNLRHSIHGQELAIAGHEQQAQEYELSSRQTLLGADYTDLAGRELLHGARGQELRAQQLQHGAAGQELTARGQLHGAAGQELQAQGQVLQAGELRHGAQGQRIQAAGQLYTAQGQRIQAAGQVLQAGEIRHGAQGQDIQAQQQAHSASGQRIQAEGQVLQAKDQSIQAQYSNIAEAEALLQAKKNEAQANQLHTDIATQQYKVGTTLVEIEDLERRKKLFEAQGKHGARAAKLQGVTGAATALVDTAANVLRS